MSGCLVYVRLSGCDLELASPFKFLPLGSAHTVHKASQRNATWKKKHIQEEKKKQPSQQNVLLSAGSTAWLWCSQCSPHLDAGTVYLCSPGSAASAATPLQGTEHAHNVPIHWAHPGSESCPEPPHSCKNVMHPTSLLWYVSTLCPMSLLWHLHLCTLCPISLCQ